MELKQLLFLASGYGAIRPVTQEEYVTKRTARANYVKFTLPTSY